MFVLAHISFIQRQWDNGIVDVDRWKWMSKLYAHQTQSIGDIICDDHEFSRCKCIFQSQYNWKCCIKEAKETTKNISNGIFLKDLKG